MKYRYPASLFIIGLIADFFFRFFFLSIPGIILLIIGIRVRPCLYIGLALLLADAILSVIERFRIKRTMETESSDPDFREFQEAASSPDWRKGVLSYAEDRIKRKKDEDGGQ